MPKDMKASPTLAEITEQARRQTISKRLSELDGNRKKTAESLDLSRQQLQNLIKAYGITVPPPIRYRHRWDHATSGNGGFEKSAPDQS